MLKILFQKTKMQSDLNKALICSAVSGGSRLFVIGVLDKKKNIRPGQRTSLELGTMHHASYPPKVS